MASWLGLGRTLEAVSPQAAVEVSPLNADARVEALTAALSDPEQRKDIDRIEAETRAALVYDPIDARLVSILGAVKQLQGDDNAARSYFQRSRQLSKTEVHALEQSISWSLRSGRIGAAVADLDALLRRWPERFAQVAPAFLPILDDENGYVAVVNALAEGAPWRRPLFDALARSVEGGGSGERLIADLGATALPATPAEISAIIGGYIALKQYDAAYRLFLFTLSDEQRKHAGFVFNPDFGSIALERPFDWQVYGSSGIEVALPGRSGVAEGAGARLRFLNAPVKEIGLRQYIQLPPGSYDIAAVMSGESLKLPKELTWEVSCVETRNAVARLPVEQGSFSRRSTRLGFEVPAQGCGLQLLQLRTNLIAESWRYRYQGMLTVHSIRIERQPA